jgi:hypothetical protein
MECVSVLPMVLHSQKGEMICPIVRDNHSPIYDSSPSSNSVCQVGDPRMIVNFFTPDAAGFLIRVQVYSPS